MRLASITITDLAAFGGTHTFLLHPVTLLQGDHGVGKTSLQEIMAYGFGRRPLADPGSRGISHDPSILHGACEKGDAVIAFDDGSTFRVAVTQDTTSRMVKVAGGKKWNTATADYIDSLVNALSYDPFTFKELDEKKRVEALLKASPVTVSIAEMQEAIGDLPITLPSREIGLHDVNASHAALYDLRREANSTADVQGKHAEELERKIVPDEGESPDVATLRSEKETLEKSERDLIERLRKAIDQQKTEEQVAHDGRCQSIHKSVNDRIAQLEAERTAGIEASSVVMNGVIDDARALANQAVSEKRAEIAPRLEVLTAAIAVSEEHAIQRAKQEGTREAAQLARRTEAQAKADSDKIDAAMTRLAALKEVVAGRLAISGITIASPRVGQPVDICREENGALIPFSRWNEADKERFCLRMAVLFHGACGVVFVDEIGHFTEERRGLLLKAAHSYAESEGMQFVMGEATGGELKVVEG